MAQRKKNPTAGMFSALSGMKKDAQSVTAEWQILQSSIHGVQLKEVRHVPKESGHLTEVWRADWALDTGPVQQVFQVLLKPGGVSAWHTHLMTTDRLFANHGLVQVVLYDARKDSPTHGRLNIFRIGIVRPTLVIIPPGVWHGVQNIGAESALLLNLVDRAYSYEDPDHWRLGTDSNEIPYRFDGANA